MQIKSYTKAELKVFIHSEFFRVLNKVPISFQRGWSQYNNPHCSDDDILLWAAYENADLVGYVGVLPDIIQSENGEKKIHWLSCFWVEESFRQGNLASQLFYLLIKQYKDSLYISNFLLSFEKTYLNLGIFQNTQYKKGRTFYINLCFASMLEARYPDLKSLMTFYKLLERSINELLKSRKGIHKKGKRKFKIVENKRLNDELDVFLQTFTSKDKSLVRGIEYFRWILEYPWMSEGKADRESGRYFFSSKADQFEHRMLKIYEQEDKLVGIVLLKIRDKNMVINHIYANDAQLGSIAAYLVNLSLKELINTITTFDNRLSDKLRSKRTNFIYIRNIKRPYLFPRNHDISVDYFQEGDGDSVFT